MVEMIIDAVEEEVETLMMVVPSAVVDRDHLLAKETMEDTVKEVLAPEPANRMRIQTCRSPDVHHTMFLTSKSS